MNIIFVGGFFPLEMVNKFMRNSKGQIANANNALQWSLIEGLKSNGIKFEAITTPQVGAFPFKYKEFYVSGGEFQIGENIKLKSLGFVNLIFLKHYFKYYAIKKELSKLIKSYGDEKVVLLIYDLYPPYLKAARDLKHMYANVATCLIVPDLYGFTGTPDNVLHRIHDKIQGIDIFKGLSEVDSYVLLSEHMKERLPVGVKPWVLVEGIFNTMDLLDVENVIKGYSDELKIIFYSGAIDRRNGVHNLIEAFSNIKQNNYLLILCGDGYDRNYVLEAANKDKRIIYKGQLPREEVLKLQQCATLLVNPRSPEGEFTRYSFPSKTMEYFASGIPVFMYKLDGIPLEYYQFCYTCDDLSASALSEKIIEICELDKMELREVATKAKEFILSFKTPKLQVEKIISLLKSI